jgi:hypothetical protein
MREGFLTARNIVFSGKNASPGNQKTQIKAYRSQRKVLHASSFSSVKCVKLISSIKWKELFVPPEVVTYIRIDSR